MSSCRTFLTHTCLLLLFAISVLRAEDKPQSTPSVAERSTQNLLHGELDRRDIAEILAQSPRHPLLPPMNDTAWATAAQAPAVRQWLNEIRPLAEREIDLPLPELTPELYGEFHRNGLRLRFQGVYYERRRMLARAALCLLLASDNEDREKFARSVIQKTQGILDEPSWAVPAHVNDPSGQNPMVIDLFAADTSNQMAETLNLFGEILPEELKVRVHERLRRQFFHNYVENHAKLVWTSAGMNWNAVCHQGVLGAALAIETDNELLAQMLWLARRSLPIFLSGFGKDGSTSEGPDYWAYGFGRFAWLSKQLETRTGGRLSLLAGDAHVREIAHFGPRMTLRNLHYVNFADCPSSGLLDPALMRYLGDQFQDRTLITYAREGYRHLAETGIDAEGKRKDLFHLTRLLLHCPTDLDSEQPVQHEDVLLPDLGALVLHGHDNRGHYWEFAAKAGNNNEHHNHNDCGTFILNIDGAPLVREIGTPEYVGDYFGSKRYEFLAARTRGHSLPIVNGFEQAAGAQYAAKVLTSEITGESAEFVIDLTACYQIEADCRKLVRTFRLDRRAGILSVTDSYELNRFTAFETAIITEAPVRIENGCASILGKALRLQVEPLSGTRIETVQELPYRGHTGREQKIHRTALHPEKSASQGSVGYEFRIPN